jgi:hypothetical protein
MGAQGSENVCIVFDGPPDHESGRFVEVEDADGHSISIGRWEKSEDGFWRLWLDAEQVHDTSKLVSKHGGTWTLRQVNDLLRKRGMVLVVQAENAPNHDTIMDAWVESQTGKEYAWAPIPDGPIIDECTKSEETSQHLL